MTVGNSHSSDPTRPSARPLRLVSPGVEPVVPTTAPAATAAASSPTLRRLQRELTEAMAEARSLRELLEELPTILERKFQQRLRALQMEQRQLEQENALLQQHLVGLLSAGAEPAMPPEPLEAALHPSPSRGGGEGGFTAGLGLRRALRRLHR